MLSADDIKKLKQTNVSINGALTKQRVNFLWKAAAQEKKVEIESLCNQKRSAVARVYKTGAISTKIAVAIAQVINVDPSYLTGEIEEQGECTDKTLESFLIAKGYKEEAKKVAKPTGKPRMRRVKPDEATTKDDDSQKQPEVHEQQLPETQEQITHEIQEPSMAEPIKVPDYSDMSEEETMDLLRLLFIKGKYSETAKEILAQIKALLLK